jgi:hypothetical protein
MRSKDIKLDEAYAYNSSLNYDPEFAREDYSHRVVVKAPPESGHVTIESERADGTSWIHRVSTRRLVNTWAEHERLRARAAEHQKQRESDRRADRLEHAGLIAKVAWIAERAGLELLETRLSRFGRFGEDVDEIAAELAARGFLVELGSHEDVLFMPGRHDYIVRSHGNVALGYWDETARENVKTFLAVYQAGRSDQQLISAGGGSH